MKQMAWTLKSRLGSVEPSFGWNRYLSLLNERAKHTKHKSKAVQTRRKCVLHFSHLISFSWNYNTEEKCGKKSSEV